MKMHDTGMRGTDAFTTRTALATAMGVSVGQSGSARSEDTKSNREKNMDKIPIHRQNAIDL